MYTEMLSEIVKENFTKKVVDFEKRVEHLGKNQKDYEKQI